MKVREVIKRLKHDGWTQIRMRGSHRVFKHATKPGRIVVAGSPGNEFATGTLHEIYKQAGWERER